MTDDKQSSFKERYKEGKKAAKRRDQQDKEMEELREKLSLLEKALTEEKKRADDYLSRMQYLQADFENYIKRIKRDVDDQKKFATKQMVVKLLDIAEDLERAVESVKSIGDNPLNNGVQMVLKELKKLLQQEGISEIESVGKLFNPDVHEAVGQVETDNNSEGKVIRELRRGYMLHGKVLRPSMVEVTTKKTTNRHCSYGEGVKKDE
ncbi:nucleotide exchange factor GrpE [[Eubacterium] cellulosolvens]